MTLYAIEYQGAAQRARPRWDDFGASPTPVLFMKASEARRVMQEMYRPEEGARVVPVKVQIKPRK